PISVPGRGSLILCSPLASGALFAPSARSFLTADVVLGAQQLGRADRDHRGADRGTTVEDSLAALDCVNDNGLPNEGPPDRVDVRPGGAVVVVDDRRVGDHLAAAAPAGRPGRRPDGLRHDAEPLLGPRRQQDLSYGGAGETPAGPRRRGRSRGSPPPPR